MLLRETGGGGVHDALEVANLLEDALASREELVNKARERQHSEARVLDLRKLVLLKLALVLALRRTSGRVKIQLFFANAPAAAKKMHLPRQATANQYRVCSSAVCQPSRGHPAHIRASLRYCSANAADSSSLTRFKSAHAPRACTARSNRHRATSDAWYVCSECGTHQGESKGIEGEVARLAPALDGREACDAAEDLEERGPEQDLRHAARLDEVVVRRDLVNLRRGEGWLETCVAGERLDILRLEEG